MSINKVQLANGETLIDLTDATATAETVLAGYTAYGADGNLISGIASSLSKTEVSVSLPSSGWANNQQAVSVAGVTANSTVCVRSDSASYENCYVYCSAQSNGSLTFSCVLRPLEDVTAIVLIFD